MIRINLLPVRQVRKVQARRRQLMIFAALLVVELLLMFVFYQQKAGDIERQQRAVADLQVVISKLKQEVGDFDELKTQRDRLISQREVINSLHHARTGPVAMLREISDITTSGKGPTVNQNEYEALLRRDPSAGYSPRWNPRRLWIESLDEQDKRLNIVGKAKDHDDVAEFATRLGLSQFFDDVQLGRNDQVTDPKLGLKLIRFKLSCAVTY